MSDSSSHSDSSPVLLRLHSVSSVDSSEDEDWVADAAESRSDSDSEGHSDSDHDSGSGGQPHSDSDPQAASPVATRGPGATRGRAATRGRGGTLRAGGDRTAPVDPEWDWKQDESVRQHEINWQFSPSRPPGNYLPNQRKPSDYKLHELVFLFFDDANSLLMVETNRIGRRNDVKWRDITVEEMICFWAILIGMGLAQKPTLKDYWRDDLLGIPAFRQIMPRDRFLKILRHLRCMNVKAAEEPNGVGDPNSAGYDRLFKVRPVLDAVLYRFGLYRQPERELSIDEQMIDFRGRCPARQVILAFDFLENSICKADPVQYPHPHLL